MRRLALAAAVVAASLVASTAKAQCGSGQGLFASWRAEREARIEARYQARIDRASAACGVGHVHYASAGGSCYSGSYGATYYSAPQSNCSTGNCPPGYATQVGYTYSTNYGGGYYAAPLPTAQTPPVPPKATPVVPPKAAPQAIPAPPPAPPTTFAPETPPPVVASPPERVAVSSTKTYEYATADGRKWRQTCQYGADGIRLSCGRPTRIG